MNKLIVKFKESILKFLKDKDPLFLGRWESPLYVGALRDNSKYVKVSGRFRRSFSPGTNDTFMFIEDMYHRTVPFLPNRSDRENYPVTIEPADQVKEEMISSGISSRGYSVFLADAVNDFIRTAAHVLFQEGVVFYEIIYEKDETGKVTNFDLELIHPVYFFRLLSNYYQIIPWWVAKESHVRVQVVKIPCEKILRIDFPKEIGGKRNLIKTLKRLDRLGKEVIPQFHMDAMKKNMESGFDLAQYNTKKYLEIAQLTTFSGWNQRGSFSGNITEYYFMLRHVTEKRTLTILRDTILSKLNETFNRTPLNLGVKVIVHNLLSISDVEAQIKKLKTGDIAFKDIIDALKED